MDNWKGRARNTVPPPFPIPLILSYYNLFALGVVCNQIRDKGPEKGEDLGTWDGFRCSEAKGTPVNSNILYHWDSVRIKLPLSSINTSHAAIPYCLLCGTELAYFDCYRRPKAISQTEIVLSANWNFKRLFKRGVRKNATLMKSV